MNESQVKVSQSPYQAYCCPVDLSSLRVTGEGLYKSSTNDIYRFIDVDCKVVDFIANTELNPFDHVNRKAYDSPVSMDMYRNFLDWLFMTFSTDEATFRQDLVRRLQLSRGAKVLITGCGFGDDIDVINQYLCGDVEIHAQDLSKSMVTAAASKYNYQNVFYSVSSATSLPYQSRYFDAVFHFGGINLFGDISKSISEMERVCKLNGIILFGDEGVAEHLRETQYADIVITNNKLWAAHAPIHLLPGNASNIQLSYVLGNCFYLIQFSPHDGLPKINIDIPHQGLHGGTARTRYFGQTEGLTESTKEKLNEAAKHRGISIHNLLELAIKKFLT